MRTVRLLLIFLAASLLLVPGTQAQEGPYVIALLGGRWVNYDLKVQVPSEPTWARQAVLDAMQTWNDAQLWFKTTYYPNGSTYKFVEAEHGPITVRYVSIMSENLIGSTSFPQIVGGKFYTATVTLSLTSKGKNLTAVKFYFVAIHEFGHVLGLDHAYGFKDIMNSFVQNLLPSTLDLYAVHVLADGDVPSQVTLPSSIPYMEALVKPIPEFPTSYIVFLPILLALLVSRKRSRVLSA